MNSYIESPFRRDWPLVALALASVFEYRFGASPSVTLLELVGLAVLFQMFLDKIALGSRFDRQITHNLRYFVWPIVFVGWVGFLGILTVATRSNVLNFFLFRNFFSALVIVIAIATYGFTDKSLQRLVNLYLAASVVIALIGISQMLTGSPQIVPYNWAADLKMDVNGRIITDVNKATGFAAHPNLLASFFILPVALCVWRLRCSKHWSHFVITFVAVALICVATYGTHAKGGWAWILLAMGLVFTWPTVMLKRHWLAFVLVSLCGLFLLFGSLYLFDAGYKSFATMLTRVRLWQAAWSIASNSAYVWLLGNGQELMPVVSWHFSDIQYPNAHSGLVNIFLFYGLPGGVLFLLAVLGAIRACNHSFPPSSPRLQRLNWTLALSVSIYFWNSLFEPHLEGGSSLAQFFLCLGLCYGFRLMEPNKPAMVRP